MINRIFLYGNGLANQLSAAGFSMLVFCLCMLSSSCDSDFMLEDNGSGDTAPVVLKFSTSIEKLSANSNTRAISNGGLIEGNTFPDGTYEIGMFITRNAGADDVFPGSDDNMKAIMTRSNKIDSWVYAQKDGSPTTPMGYTGKHIRVVAYWPYNVDATASGIPFDFTNVSAGQSELLYIKPENQKMTIGDGNLQVHFAHAYSRIVLNIRKSVSAGTIRVSSASIINQSGNWIKNSGMIDPATGYPTDGAQSGNITDATENVLTLTASDTKYEFLVPAFMDESVVDGNIGIRLEVDGKETVFNLKRGHLNTRVSSAGTTEYGFRQGYTNTYELTYDNLTMSLQLRDWTVVKPEGDFGLPGIVDANYKGWLFDCKDITLPDGFTANPITDHTYETYLTDLGRGNNGSPTAMWIPDQGFKWTWNQEPPRNVINFAMSDAIAVPVQWKSRDGIMVAKQLCKDYREGGYSNWRLPRMAEWYVFMRRIKESNENEYLYYPQQYGGKIPSEDWYWSGTESLVTSDRNDVQIIKLSIFPNDIGIIGTTLSPTSMAMVRCVRDADPVTN